MSYDDVWRGRLRAGADTALLWHTLLPEGGDVPTEAVLIVDAHVSMRVWDRVVQQVPEALAENLTHVRVVRLLGTDETVPSRVGTDSVLGATEEGTRRVILVVTDGLAAGWHLGTVQPLIREWTLNWPLAVINVLPPHLWFRTGLDVSHVQVKAPGPWTANASWEWRLREAPPGLWAGAAGEADGEGEDAAEGDPPSIVPVLSLLQHGAKALSGVLTADEPLWRDLPALVAHRWKARPDSARAFPWADEFLVSQSPPTAASRVSDFRAAASPTAFQLATRLAAAPLSLPVIRALIHSTPGAEPVHASELFLGGLVRPTGVRDDAPEAVVYDFLPNAREQLLAVGRRSATIRTVREVRSVLANVPSSASLLPPPSASLCDPTVPSITSRNAYFHRVELSAMVAVSFLGRAAVLRDALRWHDQRHAVRLNDLPPAAPDAIPYPRPVEDQGALRMTTTPQRPEEGVRTAQPRVWSLPPRNQNFTGRTELLDLLDERLGEGTTTVLPEAIHGMGGVGKTQLAIEYAYRHQAEFDIIWWIPSERPGQIGQSLVELARRLGLTTSSEVNVAGPAVREALREGKPFSRWMLIFDNADSPEQVRPYFPTGGTGTILVTSRNRRWGLVSGSLEVDVFTREESKELLRGSGPILAEEEAEALADALGDLPLALVQAAAWRAETGMSAAEYLRLFESKKDELLETAPPPDYQLPVAAAWNVSLDHLETRSPAALRLLQLCSYFAPDPISRKILSRRESNRDDPFPELNATLSDPMKLARAIREINRYSLARIDHRTNSIEMHRLVQHVLINRMSPQEQDSMRGSAHRLMATADPGTPTDPTSWDRYAELYTHVMASNALRSEQSWTRDLVINVAKYLYHWGEHEVAVDFSESAWKAWLELFGEEDHQTLLMGQWLTWMYWTVGRYQEASDLVEHVRRVYDRVADPDAESVLDAIDTEAGVRRAEGRFQDAVELNRVAYDRAVRAFREDDPVTLNIAHNLGVSLRLTGAFREALELDRKTWGLKLRVFGRDEQRSLITENSIAIDVREIGDYIGARRLQESALSASRELFGGDNPNTIDTVRELGIACRKAGDHARALEFALEAQEGFTRRYGETHPRSLASALTLAIALRQNGDLDSAHARGLQVCSGYRTVFHERHPYTMSADVGLAVSERLLGRPEEAHRLDEAALEALVDAIGPLHPFTLVTAINLASDLAALGEYRTAVDRGRETLARCLETFGPDHPTTLACAGNLAQDLVSIGLHDEGAALRRDTGERLERVLNTSSDGQDATAPHPAAIEFRAGARANCDIDPLPL
ncbi:FxSxx-COOH system tetratricopeptide repeat protein [Streptomyces sp. NPDC094149]|uniref:FxSxx-COOH system tetratricopeptide repeat protein n=1 Tax=Streptomyces sp. NPDC094149 TaxID=3155079 RepID=UPI003322DD87